MDRPFQPRSDTSHVFFLAIAVPLEPFDALARTVHAVAAGKAWRKTIVNVFIVRDPVVTAFANICRIG